MIEQEWLSEWRAELLSPSCSLGVVEGIHYTEEPKLIWHYTGYDEDHEDQDADFDALIQRVGKHYGVTS